MFHTFEGGAHYGSEREFEQPKDRMTHLREYARDAKVIYEVAERSGKEPKSAEDREKYARFKTYRSYGSDLILTEIFREKARTATRAALVLKETEKKNIDKNALMELQVRCAVGSGKVAEMIETLGPLLEYAHRRTIEHETEYYHEFKPLSREEAELSMMLESPMGTVKTAHDAFNDSLKDTRQAAKHLEEVRGDKEEDRLAKIDYLRKQKKTSNLAEARDYLRSQFISEDALTNPFVIKQLEKFAKTNDEKKELMAVAEAFVASETKGAEAYEATEERITPPLSKKEAKERIGAVSAKLDGLWKNDVVRYKLYQEYLGNLIKQDQSGDPVLETPSVVHLMNELAEWEHRHDESPIGGVLIGPPGTGKSLGVEHYLATHPEHKKKGSPVIIDMSQETTEWMLLGGEKVEVTDKASTVKMLSSLFNEHHELAAKIADGNAHTTQERTKLEEQFTVLDERVGDIITAFIAKHVSARKELRDAEEAQADNYAKEGGKELADEFRGASSSEKMRKNDPLRYKALTEWMTHRIDGALSSWQAEELGKIVYGNGWRDGVMLKALKEGRDIIINEYNNFRISPDAIRQLLQTAYGSEWFHSAEGKPYLVESRIYFTANEGSSASKFFNDAASITAAFQSRLSPPIEIDLPTKEEEFLILEAKMSDMKKELTTKGIVRERITATEALKDAEFSLEYNEQEAIAYLFEKVVPRLRALSVKHPGEMPSIDLRHIDRFCRELVNRHVRERTDVSVEEAFVKQIISPFQSNANAWNILINENIIIDQMYKVGMLHDTRPGSYIRTFMENYMANKLGLDIRFVDEEGKKNALTKIREELQKYDSDLIKNLETMEGEKWKNITEELKKKKKAVVLNPYLKTAIPNTFSASSLRPVMRVF